MAGDLPFARKIRTSDSARKMFPVFVETVPEAIDLVQELPRELRSEWHWQDAQKALWAALDNLGNKYLLQAAEDALCVALRAEDWLNEFTN